VEHPEPRPVSWPSFASRRQQPANGLAGDDKLRLIARELAQAVRSNARIDGTLKEPVRAVMRVTVERILSKHGYRPASRKRPRRRVLERTEVLCRDWAA